MVCPPLGEQVGEGHRQHHPGGKAQTGGDQPFVFPLGKKDDQRPQQGTQPGDQGQQQGGNGVCLGHTYASFDILPYAAIIPQTRFPRQGFAFFGEGEGGVLEEWGGK